MWPFQQSISCSLRTMSTKFKTSRKTRDINYVRCIKDEEGKMLATKQDFEERWKSYFHKLFNDGPKYYLGSNTLHT